MSRLFFALELPPSVSDMLEDRCEGVPQARWAWEQQGFHLTLSFLGEVSAHQQRIVREVAESVVVPPFKVELDAVGIFPQRGQPRVLWAGVKPSPELQQLHRILQAELRREGFTFEKRKYRPHVTLARLDSGPPEAVSDWIARNISLKSEPFFVREFHLVSSKLHPRGSRYTVERSFRLRGLP